MIPVSKPFSLDGEEKQNLLKCLEEGGWISGTVGSKSKFINEFESGIANSVGRKHGISVSSGTAALQVAVDAIKHVYKLEDGDEVILPAFTIISCALAIVRAGLKPVLVDADPDTWNMNVDKIEEKITPRTRAIMVVHIYGLPVDMDPVIKLAEKHGLKIIEDCAEEIGQMYRDRRCGSFGDISIMSFYPNKHITTGEGGMVLTDNDSLAKQSSDLRNLCFDDERRYIHKELGYNFRMTNLQAALGLPQLRKLKKHVERKREIGTIYNRLLKDVHGLQLPVAEKDYAENIYWIYGVVLGDEIQKDASYVIKALKAADIEARYFFCPMHKQPCLTNSTLHLFGSESYPEAERLAERGFYIPSGPNIDDADIARVAETLKRILK